MSTIPVVHKPVLVQEVLHYLDPQPGKTYLDVTFGSGGHTRALLEAEPTCTVIAMDWDMKALETFGPPLQDEFGDRLKLVWGNFAHLYKLLAKERIGPLQGILADFGTSQGQLASKEGFSFLKDTPLDMRMAPSHQKVTAADILNKASEEKLVQIFSQLGEERYSRTIAKAIVHERSTHRFKTTRDLAAMIERLIPHSKRKPGIHPATRIFQALRIYINRELDNIHAFLPIAIRALDDGARLVCISFHSLEDRIVKNFFAQEKIAGRATILTPKPIESSAEEKAKNPSARSAKLRALEIIKER